MQLAQLEARMPCHKHFDDGLDYEAAQYEGTKAYAAPQCAGRAIYWANQFKLPRRQDLLVLPADPKVFSFPKEFLAHHNQLKDK